MSRPQKPIPSVIPTVGRTDTLTKGAKKALGNFIEGYGEVDGVEIFLDKAEEQGTGSTIRQKVNSVYKKGAKLNGQS
jgi:hypothetical protein